MDIELSVKNISIVGLPRESAEKVKYIEHPVLRLFFGKYRSLCALIGSKNLLYKLVFKK